MSGSRKGWRNANIVKSVARIGQGLRDGVQNVVAEWVQVAGLRIVGLATQSICVEIVWNINDSK